MNYSGKTEFKFEIERFRNRYSGELVSNDSASLDENDEAFNASFEYKTFTLQITGSAHFYAGRLSGPPELCSPDDSDVSIISAIGPDNKDWYHLLTSKEEDLIIEMIEEKVSEQSQDDDWGAEDYYYSDSAFDN